MRLIKTSYITLAMLAGVLVLPAGGWAQSAAETAKEATPAAVPSRRESVEQRIADLHETLKITPAQDAIFNAFGQVMLDNAQAMQAIMEKSSEGAATRTAEETLKRYVTVAKAHAENVEKLSVAFDTLYAALSPDQKAVADETFRTSMAAHQENKEQKTGG
jgi:hypothetical protein